MKIKNIILFFIFFYSVVCLILINNKIFIANGSDSLTFIHQVNIVKQIAFTFLLDIVIILLVFIKKVKFRKLLWVSFGLSLFYFVISTHTVVVCYKNMVIRDLWCGFKIQEFNIKDTSEFTKGLIIQESKFCYFLKETETNSILLYSGLYPVNLNLHDIRLNLFFLNEEDNK